MATKRKSLLSIVEERAITKKRAEEETRLRELKLIPYLPNDCVFDILLRLPIESLQRARFVCRPWYRIIRSPKFIETHLSSSENTILFLTRAPQQPLPEENRYTFSIEDKVLENEKVVLSIFKKTPPNPVYQHNMCCLKIREGKSEILDYHATCMGEIKGSCNGLLLLDNKIKKGGMIVFNPITRDMLILPLGTLFPSDEESYGLVYLPSTKQYKIIHLFRDKSRYVSCEILDIGTRLWRAVDGPSSGLFSWFGYKPVQAIGALHWVPHSNDSEYIVSMDIENEDFHSIPLPRRRGFGNGIVEFGGHLGFVTREENDQIDLWILRSLFEKEWTKEHSIKVDIPSRRVIVPLCCTRIDGEILVQSGIKLYVYDFHTGLVREVEIGEGFRSRFLYSHVNSLVSLQSHGAVEDMDCY